MVESWGLGHPDFSAATGRTEVLANQTPLTVGASAVLPPGAVLFPMYVVPENYRFVIGYMKVSYSPDCITNILLLKNWAVFLPVLARGIVIIPIPDTAGFVFEAGDILGAGGTNPLDVPLTMSFAMSGFLYPVL